MANSSRSGTVDAHLGKESRKVSGLDRRALFQREASGAKGVLDHHPPYCLKTNTNVFSSKRRSRNFSFHLGSLGQSVLVFMDITAIRGKTDAKGTLALVRRETLDRFRAGDG
jgi:hypothetical protein